MIIPSGIQTILFDLDNTLIDRDRAIQAAFRQWLAQRNVVALQDPEEELELLIRHDRSGQDMLPFCDWLISRYDLKEHAPEDLLREIQDLALAYIVPDPELLAFLNELNQSYHLALASNGSSVVQRRKLERSGLDQVFESRMLFISGEMGCAKPQPEFYRRILESLRQRPDTCLMIGDHYQNDIEAARHCGLQTCWFNPQNNITATAKEFMITQIRDLKPVACL